ncbi:MAG: flagellar biosynthesis anti-sigma factor FlgM [Phycisphaerae bacterium]|jgi:anti-sigma28 factor (negative regulator of flagellin synthesis)
MIHNVDGVHAAAATKPVDPAGAIPANATPVELAGISDVVEISDAAKLIEKVHQIPDVRVDLVERVKAEIAAGTYETPERIEIALNNLMDDLLGTL